MPLKIKKAQFEIFGKQHVIFPKDVKEIGIIAGCLAIDYGDGRIATRSCDWELWQEDVPEIIESQIVEAS
jgi:hypothetical protein